MTDPCFLEDIQYYSFSSWDVALRYHNVVSLALPLAVCPRSPPPPVLSLAPAAAAAVGAAAPPAVRSLVHGDASAVTVLGSVRCGAEHGGYSTWPAEAVLHSRGVRPVAAFALLFEPDGKSDVHVAVSATRGGSKPMCVAAADSCEVGV
jgi:hypothetical protein